MAQQRGNGFRRANAGGHQIADVLKDRHADAQALARPVVGQFLRRRGQIAGGNHQIVDPVRGREEPGVRRRRRGLDHRHRGRFDHGESRVAGGNRPSLGGQLAARIGDPGRIPRFVQRQRQRLREGLRGNRRRFARGEGRGGSQRRQFAVERRLDPIHDEEAVALSGIHHPVDHHRVDAVQDRRAGDRQLGLGRLLVVKSDRARHRAVEADFRQVVRGVGRARPAHEADLQLQIVAREARQIQREARRQQIVGLADDAGPEVEVLRHLGHAEKESIFFEMQPHREHRGSTGGERFPPRHGQSLAFRNQIGGIVHIPVADRRSGMEDQPVAGRVEENRNRPPLLRDLQGTGCGQRPDVRKRPPHAGGDGGQAHAVDAFALRQDFQHGRRPGRRRRAPKRRRNPFRRRLGSGGLGGRRGSDEPDGMRAEIAHSARKLDFLQPVDSLDTLAGGGIDQPVGGAGLVERRRRQPAVEPGLRARFRIHALDEESRRPEFRFGAPDHVPGPVRPFSPDVGQGRARGIHRGDSQIDGQMGFLPAGTRRLAADGEQRRPGEIARPAGNRIAVDLVVVARLGVADNLIRAHGGQIEAHHIASAGNLGKQVIAVGIGGGLGHDRPVGADQRDRHIREAVGFTRILNAVPIGIEPHPVADRNHLIQTRIHRGIDLAAVQPEQRGEPGGRGRIAVPRVIARIRHREPIARRSFEAHEIETRNQIRERIDARRGGRPDPHHIGGGIVQPHHDIGQPHALAFLPAVSIRIVPDPVADGRQAVEPRVPARVVRSAAQRKDRRAPGAGGAVAVLRVVAALILRRGHMVRRGDEFEEVGPRRQIREAIGAVGGGRRFRQQVRRRPVDSHRHARQSGFAGVLQAIGVDVEPDPVAHARPAFRHDDNRTAVVGGNGIEQVAPRDRGGVGDALPEGVFAHGRVDLERRGGVHRQRPDGPGARSGVIGAVGVAVVLHLRRQHVGENHARRHGRPVVRRHQGVGDNLQHVRRGIRDQLPHAHIREHDAVGRRCMDRGLPGTVHRGGIEQLRHGPRRVHRRLEPHRQHAPRNQRPIGNQQGRGESRIGRDDGSTGGEFDIVQIAVFPALPVLGSRRGLGPDRGARGDEGGDVITGASALGPPELPQLRERTARTCGDPDIQILVGIQPRRLPVERQRDIGLRAQIRPAPGGLVPDIGIVDHQTAIGHANVIADRAGRSIRIVLLPIPGPILRAILAGIGPRVEFIAEGADRRLGRHHLRRIRNEGQSRREEIFHRNAGLRDVAGVFHDKGVGDRVARRQAGAGIRGLGQAQPVHDLHQPGVPAGVVGARRQMEQRRAAGGGIRIAVQRIVAALVPQGEGEPRRRLEFEEVIRGRQIGEAIGAGDRTGRAGHEIRGAVVQPNHHAGHAGLAAAALKPVDIHVAPHEIADRGGRLVEARVPAGVVRSAAQRERRREAGGGNNVAVQRVVASLILRRGHVIRRGNELQDIQARRQIREAIGAGRTAGRRRDQVRGRAIEPHRHARQTAFAAVLDAVAVRVEPHPVANRIRDRDVRDRGRQRGRRRIRRQGDVHQLRRRQRHVQCRPDAHRHRGPRRQRVVRQQVPRRGRRQVRDHGHGHSRPIDGCHVRRQDISRVGEGDEVEVDLVACAEVRPRAHPQRHIAAHVRSDVEGEIAVGRVADGLGRHRVDQIRLADKTVGRQVERHRVGRIPILPAVGEAQRHVRIDPAGRHRQRIGAGDMVVVRVFEFKHQRVGGARHAHQHAAARRRGVVALLVPASRPVGRALVVGIGNRAEVVRHRFHEWHGHLFQQLDDLRAARNERRSRRQRIAQCHARQGRRARVLDREIVVVGQPAVPVAGQAGRFEELQTHAGGIEEARIHGEVGLPARQGDGRRAARRRVRIAVGRVVARVRQRELIAGGRRKAHAVDAGGQVGEDIDSGGGRSGRPDRVGGRVVQRHPHVRQRRFPAILLAVEIAIHPRVISDRSRPDEARVHRGVRLAARQRDGRRAPRRGIRIAVRRVRARVRRRELIAGGKSEAREIGARRQIRERIDARQGGRPRADHVGRRVVERDHHVRQRRLSAILLPVAVCVRPGVVAEARRAVEPRIHGEVRLAARQRDQRRAVRARQRIAVRRVRPHVRGREQIARRRREAREVRARRQIREGIRPGRGGSRRADHVGCRAVERDHHVRQPRLPAVLLPVAIRVHPSEIAEGGRPIETRVRRDIRLPVCQRDQRRAVRARQRIAVRRVRPHVRRREQVARRRRESDEVRAGDQIRERIGARDRRRGRPDQVRRRVVQPHHHVRQRGLPAILLAVVIAVFPRPIAQESRPVEARVHRRVRLAARQRVPPRQTGCRNGVAVRRVRARVDGRGKIARRGRETHDVRAGKEIGEGIGPGRRRRGRPDHVRRRVVQPHHHVRQPRLPAVLLPVEIAVHPGEIADRSRPVEPRIHRDVRLAARQRDERRPVRARQRIAVRRVRPRVRRREQMARGRSETHEVGAGSQICERIGSGRGGRPRADHVGRRVVERDHHARQSRLPAVLLSVVVAVRPREISEGGRPVEARVHRGFHLPADQRDQRRAVRARQRIAVRRVRPRVRRREQMPGGRREPHEVGTRDQIREGIGSGDGGGRRAHRVRRRIVERDHHVRQRRLPAVLLSVEVDVRPREISEAREAIEARVHRGFHLPADQRDQRRAVRARQRIAVRRVRPRVRRREQIPRRRREAHEVRAGKQVRECIGARGRRGRRADHVRRRVVQPHHHVRQRGLPAVLLPVGVAVFPREIAERRPPEQARVQRQVRLAVGHREGRGPAGDEIRIAIDGRVGPGIARRIFVVGRQKVLREIRARTVAGGFPDAVGVRANDRRQIGAAVVHVDQHVGRARLAGVLHAVRVQIVPRPVAQRHVQGLVVEHQSAADQIEAAESRFRRGVRGKIDGVLDVHPQRAVGRRVVPHQRIAIENVVGLQPQRLPVQEHAGKRLQADIRRGMLDIAALRVAAQHDRVERDAGGPPVCFHHADRRRKGGGLPVAVQRRDRRDLEPVVAAAVHDQKAALLHVAVHRQTVGKQVVDALDVVVVPVAVADVGKHVVRAVVDQPAPQGLLHRGRVARLQKDVRPRKRRLLVEHDVVGSGDRRIGRARDVDVSGQSHAIEHAPAHRHRPEEHLVRNPLVVPDVVDRPRRKPRAAAAERRIVVVRVRIGLVGHRRARDRKHRRRRKCSAPEQAGGQNRPESISPDAGVGSVHGSVKKQLKENSRLLIECTNGR